MLVAFFESVKYTGHFFPIAFLRIYLGWQYMTQSYEKIQGQYLDEPHLAALINKWLHKSDSPEWYKQVMETVVVPYWQFFAYSTTVIELLVGISFLAGFLVRPTAILAAVLSLNFVMIGDPEMLPFHTTTLAVNLTLAWLGAGRCVGFDYFFFKRHRGLWW